MRPKQQSRGQMITIGKETPAWVRSIVGNDETLASSGLYFVYLGEDLDWSAYVAQHPIIPWAKDAANLAVVILYDLKPISAEVLATWQRAIDGYGLRASRILISPSWQVVEESRLADWLRNELAPLVRSPDTEPETAGLRVGQYVRLSGLARREDVENALLTLSFGEMRRVIEELESWRRRYLSLISIGRHDREELIKIIRIGHMKPNSTSEAESQMERFKTDFRKKCQSLGISRIHSNSIPKILLTGPTGVGKTLIARNLARSLAGEEIPFQRVAMPAFSGDEASFENQMFGAVGGSYTGVPDSGRIGIFANHIGGVGQRRSHPSASLSALTGDPISTTKGCCGRRSRWPA